MQKDKKTIMNTLIIITAVLSSLSIGAIILFKKLIAFFKVLFDLFDETNEL